MASMRTQWLLAAACVVLMLMRGSDATDSAKNYADAPKTCALYFNFSHTNTSNCFFGIASETSGELHQRADLGKQFDPQGKWSISDDGSTFAFLIDSNKTVKEHFGCCDPTSVMSVEVASGKSKVSSLHRHAAVTHAKCGRWGCGFLEIGAFNVSANEMIGWVEELLPPPPPGTVSLPPSGVGVALTTFDLTTGNATAIRPFSLSQYGPQSMDQTAFDDKHNFWFACQDTDMVTEGVCHVPTTHSADPMGKVLQITWGNKAYTITALEYSRHLNAVVVMAQTFKDHDKMASTKLFLVDPHTTSKTWPELVDLGQSWSSLHQTTISADGRYLMATLTVGANIDFPDNHLVTVDLANKKEASRIVLKHPKTITVLATVPC